MLLRTVALLLLCVSVGMCATLGHYQAEAEEDEAPAVADGAVEAASVDAAEEGGDAKVADSPAAEEPAADSLFGDDLPAKIPAVDDPAADDRQVDVPVADGATAEEPVTDSDRPAGDAPAVEAVTGEAVTHDQPSEEEEKEENEIRPVQTDQSPGRPLAREDNSWSLNSIRSGFQSVHGYFESLVELVGGQDGVCQYRCRYGELPQPRPGYQPSAPDGCSSSLVGFQLDLGIPAMTQCCNQLDVCYDTCGTSKYDCDSKFRLCLHDICSDLNKSLGFVNKVQACETMADTLFNTVWTLGCRPYMNSQRAACVCEGEERDEL
ncbi:group XIIB secretory phospholipase A2-like protein isoform X2 [Pagrus major]|uniref:group XIIB secretory phospholipase A2-like protein isoform X2 n=1 Tax=Pagrus major TaxID=143350 RepID=UPI003CC8A695